MLEPIVLAGQKELDIYVNPRRQELLRQMHIENKPITPKELSRRLNISASSVQHHIQKLVTLGVVKLHHTETIRGITARYYWVPPRTVSMGRTPNSAENAQRIAIMQNSLASTFSGFARYAQASQSPPQEALGDMNWGILHMEESEVLALKTLVMAFIHEHEKPETKGIPFEYAMIFYPIAETRDA
ncbi:MAG: winged helix-turn-helix transcriptional regulator [Firmicutes bacterium]|nr:winged helix-turn-helix transcriptional regulator [Bacillota bacterium]